MFSGISIWQLLIVLAIVVLLFGTKKLRNIGGDLGGAVKGFKDSVKDGEKDQNHSRIADDQDDDQNGAGAQREQRTRDDHKDQV